MRTKNEIIGAVMRLAQSIEEVRAVIQTDLAPIRKYLNMYNFYFLSNSIDIFDSDEIFENCFGERILLYRGDKNYPEMFPDSKAHLMVFKDGVTIVINCITKDAFLSKYNSAQTYENVWIADTYLLLLDKDNDLPKIERLEEKKILLFETPTETEFDGVCSEFYWVMKTFAEYTMRKELLSAMFYLNTPVRELLNKMLHWYICSQHDVPVEIGILDSNMEHLLDGDLFEIYKKTYPSADYDKMWQAFDNTASLWNIVGRRVAERYSFIYPENTHDNMMRFIDNLRNGKFS